MVAAFKGQAGKESNGEPAGAVDAFGNSALHWASAAGHQDVASTLMNKGATPALRNSYGAHALHAAAFAGHLSTIEVLLKVRAELSL